MSWRPAKIALIWNALETDNNKALGKQRFKKTNEISTDNIDTVRDGGVIPEGVCGNQSAASLTAAFLITEKTVSAANPFQRFGN